MAYINGFVDNKYDVFRPKEFGSKLLLIDLEAEIADKGQARCQ